VLYDENEAAWNSITEFFGARGDFLDRDTLQYKLQQSVNYDTFSLSTPHGDSDDQLQDDIHELNEGRYSDERGEILAELDLNTSRNEIVAQILIEELAFGLEMSPIFSRLKKSFQRMSAAAQSTVTLSEQYASNTADHMISWLKSELSGYRQEFSPLEALEVACKYKKMDAKIAAHKLALYREALKNEIPMTNWIAGPQGFYLSYAYNQSGLLTGNLTSDMPALAGAGFILVLLDP